MPTVLGLGLVLVSIVSYFLLVMTLGVYQRYPLPHFLGAAIGIFVLARHVVEKRSWVRIAALVLGVALSGLYVWYTLDYSTYATRELRVHEGQTISALATLERLDEQGRTQPVLANNAGTKATLLVFYRGFW